MTNILDFPLSSEELKLIILIDEFNSVKAVAAKLGRDQTTISRQIQALAAKHPVLDKSKGSWLLSALGKELAQYGRRILVEQKQILGHQKLIRIGTTKEFSEWVLSPLIHQFIKESNNSYQVQIITQYPQLEAALLDGKIDIALTCGRPIDPVIKFTNIASYPLCCVYNQKVKAKDNNQILISTPAVEHTSLTINRFFPDLNDSINIMAQFDHVAGIRAAIKSGLGWGILPSYCVKQDLKNKNLYEIEIPEIEKFSENFSIWSIRSFDHLRPVIKIIKELLS